jgi:hypothetical protein
MVRQVHVHRPRGEVARLQPAPRHRACPRDARRQVQAPKSGRTPASRRAGRCTLKGHFERISKWHADLAAQPGSPYLEELDVPCS